MQGKALQEFAQQKYTFEGASGWSRIDRVYTNLHPAVLGMMHSSCNLLPHPRHLSDHKPVVFCFRRARSSNTRRVPAWVALHPDYATEVEAEFEYACDGRTLAAFEELGLLKAAIHRASKYIKRQCRERTAESIDHKLAVSLAFIRAMESGDLTKASSL